MPFVSMLDLEKTIKIEQLLLNQANLLETHLTNNFNFNPNNNSNKAALMHQLQLQQQNSKLISNNLLLTSLKANLNAQQQIQQQQQQNQSMLNGNKQINFSRYKTELCRQFSENGECKYGEKCQFAHGFNDLKDVNRHPKYKTDFCKTFHSKGFCPYGPRCHFIHEINEKNEPVNNPTTTTTTTTPTTTAKQAILNVIELKKAQSLIRAGCEMSPKSKIDTLNELSQIDKQIEEIQTQLATSLFVGDDLNEEFSSEEKNKNPIVHKPDSIEATLDELQQSFNNYASSPGLSGPLSPIVSNTSSSSSASASSSTSPTVSSKIDNVSHKQSNPPISGKHILDVSKKVEQVELDCLFAIRNNMQSSSPASPSPRARSTTSSTSSTSSAASSTSSYDSIRFNNDANNSPIKHGQQHRSLIRSINEFYVGEGRVGVSNGESSNGQGLGPIGRPAANQILSPQSAKNLLRFSNMILQNTENTNAFLKNDFSIFNALNRHVNW